MSGLAAEVTAALGRSILPSVIARGAVGLRVVAAEDGVVTLAADGSPGAVLPILGRIEAQLRAAVPGVTAVRLAPAGPRRPRPVTARSWGLAEAARAILDAEINPAIAAHRGRVTVAAWPGAGSGSASKAAARAAAWPRSRSGRASSRCCGPACPR